MNFVEYEQIQVNYIDAEKKNPPPFCVMTNQMFLFFQDQHLNNFFHYCQKTESGAQALGSELIKYLKVFIGTLDTGDRIASHCYYI